MSERESTAATSCSTMTTDNGWLGLVDDLPEHREQVLRRLDVQPGQRLVEEEDLRVAGQGATDLDQAEDAERQCRHRRLGHPGELQQLEQAVDPLVLRLRRREQGAGVEHVPPRAARRHAGPVRQHEVLTHRQAQEELGLLERAGQPPARPRPGRGIGDVLTAQVHPAGVRPQQAGEHAEEGRLAGAVRADQAGDLARLHLDGDVGEGGEPTETDGDARRPSSAGAVDVAAPVGRLAGADAVVTSTFPPTRGAASTASGSAGDARRLSRLAGPRPGPESP